MKNKRVAILSCVSFNSELVRRQLINYSASHGEDAKHFLHVASDGDISIDELNTITNVDVDATTSSYRTSNLCNFGGQIANSKRLRASSENFGYVYIHTDADLIVKGNLADYINRYKCGFLKQKPSTNWPHYQKMISDPCFRAMRKHLGINDEDIISGRQEGAFFPFELWSEMSKLFEKFYHEDFFSDRSRLWPLEEGIVPTVAAKLIGTSYEDYKPSVTNVVVTKPLKPSPDRRNPRDIAENCVQKEDIEKTLAAHPNRECIAMKWFSREVDDPTAKFAYENLKALSLDR
jgi:hypothetical protein